VKLLEELSAVADATSDASAAASDDVGKEDERLMAVIILITYPS